MYKSIRILILLLILLGVALGAWREKTRSVAWKYTLPVNIYLINGDNSPAVTEYLRNLTLEDFQPIEAFMRNEAARYGRVDNASIEIKLGGIIATSPPEPPRDDSTLDAIGWSLRMRWWAYRNAKPAGSNSNPQVKMFLLYFDPARTKQLGHSTGLRKGLIGRVNVFASRDMAPQNNVVIAHEFLHTLGATDHYDLATNQPLYPDGYAVPDLTPLLPQRYAEIMAVRIPVSHAEAVAPANLDEVLIGSKTAKEINWR